MGEVIANATIEVYSRICAEKLPIPSKFHYTFNLRDVSKVFQGMLMIKPLYIKDVEQLTRLWIHEVSRVFHDRLINQQDRKWFYNLIVELVQRRFNLKWNEEDLFVN